MTKYFIDSKPLVEYCRENNLLYSSVTKRIRAWETPEQAVTPRDKHRKSKYNARSIYIEGVPLRVYCEEHDLDYTKERKKYWRDYYQKNKEMLKKVRKEIRDKKKLAK